MATISVMATASGQWQSYDEILANPSRPCQATINTHLAEVGCVDDLAGCLTANALQGFKRMTVSRRPYFPFDKQQKGEHNWHGQQYRSITDFRAGSGSALTKGTSSHQVIQNRVTVLLEKRPRGSTRNKHGQGISPKNKATTLEASG